MINNRQIIKKFCLKWRFSTYLYYAHVATWLKSYVLKSVILEIINVHITKLSERYFKFHLILLHNFSVMSQLKTNAKSKI